MTKTHAPASVWPVNRTAPSAVLARTNNTTTSGVVQTQWWVQETGEASNPARASTTTESTARLRPRSSHTVVPAITSRATAITSQRPRTSGPSSRFRVPSTD
jgi:hypothetical protein